MMKSESQASLRFGESSAQKYVVISLRFFHTNNKTPEHLVDDICVGIKNYDIAKAA